MTASPITSAPPESRTALTPGVVANAAYENRVPERPFINVSYCYDSNNRRPSRPLSTHPSPDCRQHLGYSDDCSIRTVLPSPRMASAVGLTPEQVHDITGNRPLEAPMEGFLDRECWSYSMRYQAQPILDYLYLGPYTVARNTEFLDDAGITMLLVVRDTRFATARLLDMSKTAQDLGMALYSVDVSNPSELIQAFPGAVKAINDHVLGAPRDKSGMSTGRVLVLCETGNGRSACVAAMYAMVMYGLYPVDALTLVASKRISMCMDDDTKDILVSYSDLLVAQSDVARHEDTDGGSGNGAPDEDKPQAEGSSPASQSRSRSSSDLSSSSSSSRKRSIEDTIEKDEDPSEDASGPSAAATDMGKALDRERFQDREAFSPFVDVGTE